MSNEELFETNELSRPASSRLVHKAQQQAERGDLAAAVKTLQRTLNKCYGESLAVDGNFGPATKAAVKRAQADHHITQDGVAGPVTLDTIKWRNSAGTCLNDDFYALA